MGELRATLKPSPLRIGVSAALGIVAQLAILGAIEQGHLDGVLLAYFVVPPTFFPTLCVAWVLARSGRIFPGSPRWAIALALASWHLALGACVVLASGPIRAPVLVMSVLGTLPIVLALVLLTHRWDWGCATGLVGAGAMVG